MHPYSPGADTVAETNVARAEAAGIVVSVIAAVVVVVFEEELCTGVLVVEFDKGTAVTAAMKEESTIQAPRGHRALIVYVLYYNWKNIGM